MIAQPAGAPKTNFQHLPSPPPSQPKRQVVRYTEKWEFFCEKGVRFAVRSRVSEASGSELEATKKSWHAALEESLKAASRPKGGSETRFHRKLGQNSLGVFFDCAFADRKKDGDHVVGFILGDPE